jgi:hypothetical protein
MRSLLVRAAVFVTVAACGGEQAATLPAGVPLTPPPAHPSPDPPPAIPPMLGKEDAGLAPLSDAGPSDAADGQAPLAAPF